MKFSDIVFLFCESTLCLLFSMDFSSYYMLMVSCNGDFFNVAL